MSELIFETDWLASRPVFYNERTGAASLGINEVIDFADLQLDAEGFNAYLGTGYSVFEHTPVRDVRYLPPSARLWRESDGRLRVEELPLDLDARLSERHSAADVLELLRARVREAETGAGGEIVIPTSGGYDSRLLNLMVEDQTRVRTFTFGASERQRASVEVARARALSQLLGSAWERIPIGRFHSYVGAWEVEFGPAVHAHGMYQMEFYDQVCARVAGGNLVLSGIFGDWFEGKDDHRARPVHSAADVAHLIHTYGQHAHPSASRVPYKGALLEEYFETHRDALASPRRRVIEAVRFRMMLLRYLLRVPELFGFRVAAPFLDMDVATAMLSLPDESRRGRLWVKEEIQARDALLEHVGGSSSYWLYWPVMRRQPLTPLDEDLLDEVVRREYVRWINRTVGWRGLWYEGYERLGRRPGFRRAAARLHDWGLSQQRLHAYHSYMTLHPIQTLLRRRNEAQRKPT